jgi:hypothetical protein
MSTGNEVLSMSEAEGGDGDDDDDREWFQVWAFRRLHYSRMQRQLAELRKNATLRSDSRGSQAHKDLLAFEKRVAEAEERCERNEMTTSSNTNGEIKD